MIGKGQNSQALVANSFIHHMRAGAEDTEVNKVN